MCSPTKENILENLLKRSPNQYDEYQEAVNEILENVKKEGDKAVFDYTKRFDKADISKETLYVTEEEIKTLGREYKKIRDGYQLKVKNTAEATRLIVEHQEIFRDYEVVKGRMDDVFLAVTGKTLGGEHR